MGSSQSFLLISSGGPQKVIDARSTNIATNATFPKDFIAAFPELCKSVLAFPFTGAMTVVYTGAPLELAPLLTMALVVDPAFEFGGTAPLELGAASFKVVTLALAAI